MKYLFLVDGVEEAPEIRMGPRKSPTKPVIPSFHAVVRPPLEAIDGNHLDARQPESLPVIGQLPERSIDCQGAIFLEIVECLTGQDIAFTKRIYADLIL